MTDQLPAVPSLETALRALLTSYGFAPDVEKDRNGYVMSAQTKAYRVAVTVEAEECGPCYS